MEMILLIMFSFESSEFGKTIFCCIGIYLIYRLLCIFCRLKNNGRILFNF